MPGKLRILLVSNGGREHALAWKLNQSARVEAIFVVPGSGGTATGMAKVSNAEDVSPSDFPSLVKFAKKIHANLVIPGPEAPLVDGIEGYFRAGMNESTIWSAVAGVQTWGVRELRSVPGANLPLAPAEMIWNESDRW